MHRTDSYVMTAYTDSAGDMLEIETIRKTISSINKINKAQNSVYSQYKRKKNPGYGTFNM